MFAEIRLEEGVDSKKMAGFIFINEQKLRTGKIAKFELSTEVVVVKS